MDDLVVNDRLVIPAADLEERFETSGGPGGQHANRSSTRVVLTFDFAGSGLIEDETKARMTERLGDRLRGGKVTVAVDDSRSQWRNRSLARRRLAEVLAAAMERPRPRRATRPSRSARRARLESKRARSEVKRLRRRPHGDD